MLLYFAPCSNPGAGGDTATGVAVSPPPPGEVAVLCSVQQPGGRGRPNSVRRPTRGLPVPSIPSIRTIRNTIMVLVAARRSCCEEKEEKEDEDGRIKGACSWDRLAAECLICMPYMYVWRT